MPRLIIACVACLLFALPAQAQTPGDDLLAGYRLGKFQVTTSMLAHELTMLVALVDQTGIGDITDENYAAGLINDEDVSTAGMVLAYAVWRCQFLILPMCEGGLASESFQHPALAEYADPTRQILGDLQADSEGFLETADFDTLVEFSVAIIDGEYIDDLMLLSEMATIAAGDEE